MNETHAKSALITGAAKRIGRAIALRLAHAGYAVALHANRSGADADALAREIEAFGGKACIVIADLTDPQAIDALVANARAKLGPLSLLVNNASLFEADEFGAMKPGLWDQHFAVNVRAPIFLSQSFAAQAGHGSSIVNILDQRVLRLTPRSFSYSLSKSALFSATTMMAQALAPSIRVNAVAPGPTLMNARQSADDFANEARSVPLGSGPDPDEIADAVLYLAQARSVTGMTIAVDGGQHLDWRSPDAIGNVE